MINGDGSDNGSLHEEIYFTTQAFSGDDGVSRERRARHATLTVSEIFPLRKKRRQGLHKCKTSGG